MTRSTDDGNSTQAEPSSKAGSDLVVAHPDNTISMSREIAAALRAPFDDVHVGKLPKVTCKPCSNSPTRVCDDPRHAKATCPDCGNWMTRSHMHLDYVGHAEVTARLISVDPMWDWEPMAVTPEGLPRFDEFGGLWIRLTIAGKTLLAYGDAEAKRRGPSAIKETIGDAIRNGAMRFGVGLDLWGAKFTEDDDPGLAAERRVEQRIADQKAAAAVAAQPAPARPAPVEPASNGLPAGEPWDTPDATPPATQAVAVAAGPTPEQVYNTGLAAVTSAKSQAALDQLTALVADFEGKRQLSAGQAGRLRLKIGVRRDELAATVPPPAGPPVDAEPAGAIVGASA